MTGNEEAPEFVDLPQFHRLRIGVDWWLVKGSERYEMVRQQHVGLQVKMLESGRAICRLRDYPYRPKPYQEDVL